MAPDPVRGRASDVREMKNRQANGLETVLLVTGVAGVIVLTIVFLSELSHLD